MNSKLDRPLANFRLAAEIFKLMEKRAPDNADGILAIAFALIISIKDSGHDKKLALAMIDDLWDQMGPLIERAKKLTQ